jgi:hypothetical protein
VLSLHPKQFGRVALPGVNSNYAKFASQNLQASKYNLDSKYNLNSNIMPSVAASIGNMASNFQQNGKSGG